MRSRREARCKACSIVYLLRVPSIQMHIEVNAVERIGNFNIPFFAIPHVWPPPVARCSPWSARGGNRTVHAIKGDPGGDVVFDLDRCFQTGSQQAKRKR